MQNNVSEKSEVSKLDEELVNLNGEILLPGQNLTYRKLFIKWIENSMSSNYEETIRVITVGQKLVKIKSVDELDIEEKSIILKIIKDFPNANNIVKAQLVLFLEGKWAVKREGIKQNA